MRHSRCHLVTFGLPIDNVTDLDVSNVPKWSPDISSVPVNGRRSITASTHVVVVVSTVRCNCSPALETSVMRESLGRISRVSTTWTVSPNVHTKQQLRASTDQRLEVRRRHQSTFLARWIVDPRSIQTTISPIVLESSFSRGNNIVDENRLFQIDSRGNVEQKAYAICATRNNTSGA